MFPYGTGLIVFLLSVFSLYPPAAEAQDYPPAWNLAHPDAKALAGVNLRNLSQSQVVQKYTSQLDTSSISMLPWKDLGIMELLKEIDQIFLSSPGATTSDSKNNPPVLLVINGHFTAASVGHLFKGAHRTYHSVAIYGSPEGKNLDMAQLNGTTLLMGDDASLRGAIDRSADRAGGVPAAKTVTLLQRAAKMAASHDFWVIGSVSPSALQPANLSFGKIAADIRGFDTGFSLRDGFAQEVSVTMATPEMAHDLAQQFSTQLRAAAASNLGAQDSADLLKKFEVTSEGPRIGLKIALNQEEVDRVIRTAKANRQKAMVQPPAIIEQPKTIKIYGLDEGVREIPLGTR